MTSHVDDLLTELEGLDTPALRVRWADTFRGAAPKGISRRLLLFALAYEIQANAFGGHKPATRRQLLRLAEPGSESAEPKIRTPARSVLAPGARLVREWRGRMHTVDVVDTGFLYAGERYRSLSQVARVITGARWSGPRFFGL
jgi:hypothetical protein